MAFVEVSAGRKKQCKNIVGGIRAIYLASFIKAKRSEIVYDKVSLTQFPQTFFYKFQSEVNSSFSQNQKENEGGKFYEQSLSLTFNKVTAFDNLNFSKFLNKEYLCVVQDRNDNYFMAGFRNGLICEKLDINNNTYTMNFEGMETELAPFCDALIGSSIVELENANRVFQNNDNYIFQDNENYKFNG
jgi:hypothetical protein